MRRLAYTVLLAVALVAVLSLADGIWLVICLTAIAFGASVLPELLIDRRHRRYRGKWELANGARLERDSSR